MQIIQNKMTNPFNSLVLLSSPVEAVMTEELRSFNAKATPVNATEKKQH